MIAKQLISENIPIIFPSDSVSSVLNLMADTHLIELPLIAEDQYLGLVTEAILLDVVDSEQTLDRLDQHWLKPAILSTAHPFEAIKIIVDFKLHILPVVDKSGMYIGALSKDSFVDYFATTTGIQEPGGILVLEMNVTDYSLAEIARICESNDISILHTSTFYNKESEKLEVTLKLNKTDLQYLTATFERFEYSILNAFNAYTMSESMSDRYDLLMNYLNM